MPLFGRSKKSRPASSRSEETAHTASTGSPQLEKGAPGSPTAAQVKRATRTRLRFSLLTSFLLLLTVIFLILVEVGNTSTSNVRSSIFFIRLNLTNIIPQSVPDSFIINSIARTLGLHDFYQVGLWNFCEGYNDEGVTNCSSPTKLYWFNPVEIILSELLAGATIALPTQVTDILNIIRLASKWMFSFFLAGAALSFLMIFTVPLSVFSRWIAFFNAIFTGIAALFVTVAAVIATVMFVIMRNAFTSVGELNIEAELGVKMMVFMYIAVGTALAAALIQIGECCCCASRRDVKSGRKRGSKKAWEGTDHVITAGEGRKKRGLFGRRK